MSDDPFNIATVSAACLEATGFDPAIDDDASRWCAAIGITQELWRNGPLEALRLEDAAMMRANIVTTRLIADHLTSGEPDWAALAKALTDHGRRIGAQTLAEFVEGKAKVTPLRRHATRRAQTYGHLVDDHGWDAVRVFITTTGAFCSWFGSPWWPELVAAALAQAKTTPPIPAGTLAETLLAHPEQLDDEAMAWCVDVGLIGHATVRAQWEANGAPRWSPPAVKEAEDGQ